jgi:hypothetical protein
MFIRAPYPRWRRGSRNFVAANAQVLDAANLVPPAAIYPLSVLYRARWNSGLSGGTGAAIGLWSISDRASNISGLFGYWYNNPSGGPGIMTDSWSIAAGQTFRHTPYTFTTGTWYSIGHSYVSSILRKCFINGVEPTNFDSGPGSTPATLTHTAVGAIYHNSATQIPFDGQLADVAFYSVELTLEEHRLFASGVSPALIQPSSLIAYYPLFEGGTVERSLGGSNPLPLRQVNNPQPSHYYAYPPLLGRRSIFLGVGGAPTIYTLTVNPGSVSLAGTALNLKLNRSLALTAGNVTYAGATLNLARNRALALTPGSVTFQGASVNLKLNRALALTPGSYTYQGASVNLFKIAGKVLLVSPGNVTYQGAPLTLSYLRRYSMSVGPGNFNYQGATLSLRWSGEPPPAAELAQLYGGGIFGHKAELREEPRELTLPEKIEVISLTPEGKQDINKTLPAQRQLPTPDLVSIEELVRAVEASGQRTVAAIETLYQEMLDEDDQAALVVIFGGEGNYRKQQ